MIKELRRIIAARHVILYLIVQQLKSAHRDKLLGNVWSLLHPLLMMFVFYFIFHNLRHSPREFMLYFLSGSIAWDAFATPVRGTARCLKQRKDLVNKFPVPLMVFPLAIVLQRVYDFLWGFLAFATIFLALKFFAAPTMQAWTPLMLLLPVWMFFYLMFTLGICLVIARVGVFFADMDDIISIFLTAGYFLNPVFIDLGPHFIAPAHHKLYLLLDPLAGFMIVFRYMMPGFNVITENIPICIPYYPFYLAGMAVLSLTIGIIVFQSGSKHYSKYL